MVLTYPAVLNRRLYLLSFCAQVHTDSITVKVLGGFEGSISYQHLAGTAADPSTCQLKGKVKWRGCTNL